MRSTKPRPSLAKTDGSGSLRRSVAARRPSMRRIVVAGSRAEVGVGDAGLLEVERCRRTSSPKTWRMSCDRRHRRRGARTARSCRRRRRPARGASSARLPHDHRAPVVADEHGPLLADVVEQAEQVVGEVVDVVVLDRLGPARPAVAALVGGERRGSRRRRAPGAGGATSRPARGSRGRGRRGSPRPASSDVEVDAVGGDGAVGRCVDGGRSWSAMARSRSRRSERRARRAARPGSGPRAAGRG